MPQDARPLPTASRRPLIAAAVGLGLIAAGTATYLTHRPASTDSGSGSVPSPAATDKASPTSSAKGSENLPNPSAPRSRTEAADGNLANASTPGSNPATAPGPGTTTPPQSPGKPPRAGASSGPSSSSSSGSGNSTANNAARRAATPKADLRPGAISGTPPTDNTVYPDGITPPIDVPESTTPLTETDKTLANVESRAKSDPAAAAAYVETFPPGDLRDEAREFVFLQWSDKDAAAATAWRTRDIAAAKAQAADIEE